MTTAVVAAIRARRGPLAEIDADGRTEGGRGARGLEHDEERDGEAAEKHGREGDAECRPQRAAVRVSGLGGHLRTDRPGYR
jgi:hypothetical protein